MLIIHGGDAFDTYKEYLENLRRETLDFEDLFKKGWKNSLQDKLGDKFQVITPRMPNGNNAKYLEWKIWFEKIIPFIKNGVILIGHSLGGMFLAQYLAENKFPKKIKATIIVAAPHTDELNESLADFIIPKNLKLLEKQGGNIFLYYSSDDLVVPNALKHLKVYQKALPKAIAKIFTDHGHFSIPEFPEIVNQIKKL